MVGRYVHSKCVPHPSFAVAPPVVKGAVPFCCGSRETGFWRLRLVAQAIKTVAAGLKSTHAVGNMLQCLNVMEVMH